MFMPNTMLDTGDTREPELFSKNTEVRNAFCCIKQNSHTVLEDVLSHQIVNLCITLLFI